MRVVQRQHVQQPIIRPPTPRLFQRRRRRRQRAVAHGHALGLPGGSRGEQHQRRRLFGEIHFWCAVDVIVQRGHRRHAVQPRRQRCRRQDLLRRRRFNEVRHLRSRVQRRQRHRRPARQKDAQHRLDVRARRLEQKRHPCPVQRRPSAAQPGRDARRPGPQLAVRHDLAAVLDDGHRGVTAALQETLKQDRHAPSLTRADRQYRSSHCGPAGACDGRGSSRRGPGWRRGGRRRRPWPGPDFATGPAGAARPAARPALQGMKTRAPRSSKAYSASSGDMCSSRKLAGS